jgi:predicted O-methyltransferase YrrM
VKKLKAAIAKTPILGRTLLIVVRAKTALRYFHRPLTNLFKWLFKSKETINFTYDLEESNIRYLASLIADIANIEFSVAAGYIKEIEEDSELRKHIADEIAKSNLSYMADKEVRFGRRIGWYAFARALKPKVIVETGVDKGLGACVLTAALKRNKEEGYEGWYYGTDINPEAGHLLSGDYANCGSIFYGDSIKSLNKLDSVIDLFVNDSDHSAAYEAEEYKTIENKLSKDAIILGDNAHCTDKLLEFSLRTNRRFIFFQERPRDHWYPGAGIGISFRR